ncbi:MAG: HAMP domain-containing protein [Deltaproteobacteria bacterium]|nr:HAMP domain-containing protein [Deltaproteobacteria bacterium]
MRRQEDVNKSGYNLNRFFGSLSIRKKLRIAFFLSAILPLTIGGIYGVYFASKTLKSNYMSELTREVEDRSKELEKTLTNVRGDILFLSRLPTLKNYVRHMPAHGESERIELRTAVLEAFSNFAKYRIGIYQIRFLDMEGWERLRVDSKGGDVMITSLEQLQNKGERYYLHEAMKISTGEIYVSSLDLNEEFGHVEVPHQLVVRFATPFVDEAGQKRGLVILNLYATDLLALIRSLETRPGVRTFFVNINGTMISMGENDKTTSLSLLSGQNVVGNTSKDALFTGKTGIIENKDHFTIFTPVKYQKEESRYWVVGLQYPKKIILKPLSEFVVVLFLIGLVIALVLFFLGGVAARQLTIPLLAIHREMEKIGKGNFNVYLDVETKDEIEDMARAMNTMAQHIRELVEKEKGWNRQLQEEIRRAEEKLAASMERVYQMEKMASLGQLSAGIAHEIGNPLAAIKTVIQAMDENITPQEQQTYFRRIISEIDRLSHFLKTFHSFVTPGDRKLSPCDLVKIAEEVIFLVGKEAEWHSVTIRREFAETPPIFGDSHQIQQVLWNLIVNALRAMPDGGVLTLKIEVQDSDSSKVSVAVIDNGVGIPQENISRIFEPFFTTHADGSGLGLAIAYKIVKEHGADIHAKSQVGHGTTFEILFPVRDYAS